MRNLALTSVLPLLLLMAPAQAQTPLPIIKVRHLTLNGLTGISQVHQQQIARDIKKQTYTDSTINGIPDRLRSALVQRGFLGAYAPAPDIIVVSSKSGEEVIDMTYQVQAGSRYRLKQISFTSNQPQFAFPERDLRQSFAISDGAAFDSEAIRTGLQKLRQLYATRGYVNCTPMPDIEPDDTSATVSVKIDVDEGAVYRVGVLVLDGVEPVQGAGAKLLESWKQYQGQVANPKLAADFMRANAAYLTPKAVILPFSEDGSQHLLNFRLSFDGPSASNQSD